MPACLPAGRPPSWPVDPPLPLACRIGAGPVPPQDGHHHVLQRQAGQARTARYDAALEHRGPSNGSSGSCSGCSSASLAVACPRMSYRPPVPTGGPAACLPPSPSTQTPACPTMPNLTSPLPRSPSHPRLPPPFSLLIAPRARRRPGRRQRQRRDHAVRRQPPAGGAGKQRGAAGVGGGDRLGHQVGSR